MHTNEQTRDKKLMNDKFREHKRGPTTSADELGKLGRHKTCVVLAPGQLVLVVCFEIRQRENLHTAKSSKHPSLYRQQWPSG